MTQSVGDIKISKHNYEYKWQHPNDKPVYIWMLLYFVTGNPGQKQNINYMTNDPILFGATNFTLEAINEIFKTIIIISKKDNLLSECCVSSFGSSFAYVFALRSRLWSLFVCSSFALGWILCVRSLVFSTFVVHAKKEGSMESTALLFR